MAGFLLPGSTGSQRAGERGLLWGLFSRTGSESRRGGTADGLKLGGGLVHFALICGFLCGSVWTDGITHSF